MTDKQLKQKARELGEQPAFPCSLEKSRRIPKSIRPAQYGQPNHEIEYDWECSEISPGLTKRECFAGMALEKVSMRGMSPKTKYEDLAKVATEMADALLYELVKEQS